MKKPIFSIAAALAAVCLAACSSTTTPSASTAGLVSGPADTHCKTTVTVDPAACQPSADAGASVDAGVDPDAGAAAGGYGDTLYNAEGDDDDCKYHVKWSAASLGQKTNVTFTLVLTNKIDGSPARGAPMRGEVFLTDTHPAPNTHQTSAETSPGTYTLGPIQFDAAGQWTVRFHFHEECDDSATSPHGHAAFYVQVP